MSLQDLHDKIEQKQAVIGVVGLGYVGLPVACVFAQAGFQVLGLDIKTERVAAINEGHLPIDGDEPGLAELLVEVLQAGRLHATTDYAALTEAHIILVAVDTPVDSAQQPDYRALKAACRQLGEVIKRGTLVIIESTVAPGTIDNLVRPLLEEASGWQANLDFYLGACPERVMPGKLLANLHHVNRVCGGRTPETAQVMVTLYRHIVQAELDTADIITAELVKTTENAYRDVQIAFANEVALICEANGADVWQVRELVNKSPYRHMHLPGTGVGGHCIPKDPWLLAYAANGKTPLYLIPAARNVNESMPFHVADLIGQALQAAGRSIAQARVAILGYAYLENSDDTRHSPSAALVTRLLELGAEVAIHDPWVPEYQGDLLERVRGCDIAVLMVKHQAYRHLDLKILREMLRTPILLDGRGFFEVDQVRAAGLTAWGVGRGNKHS